VELAKALQGLQLSKIHRMEGVTPYQTQNICNLKVNRLRLWAGEDAGYQCQVMQCGETHLGGTGHLVWECTEAQHYWGELRRKWAISETGWTAGRGSAMAAIFGFRLKSMPQWLVEWGRQQENLHWEDLQKTADEMWAVGVAVMLTAIWRRNVDRLHPEGRKEK
jgi:hypothetical protein